MSMIRRLRPFSDLRPEKMVHRSRLPNVYEERSAATGGAPGANLGVFSFPWGACGLSVHEWTATS
jgi:hypothetical protein